jgi:radical SAM-linked protein
VREQPQQQAPPVQRLRIRYAKRGRLRFTSHRDFSRAFERAVVRARIPMAYSSGFNPHPRISYAGASPTGAASEAEYLEIGLAQVTEPAEVREALDEALPPGLDVVEVVEAQPGSLSDLLEASRWRIRLPGVPVADAERAVATFLAATEVPVERMTKKGLRTFDCRAAVLLLRAADGAGVVDATTGGPACAILEVVLRHGTPSVRPDDVLAGLHVIAGLEVTAAPLHERLAQGPLDEVTGTVGDPLALNRDTA